MVLLSAIVVDLLLLFDDSADVMSSTIVFVVEMALDDDVVGLADTVESVFAFVCFVEITDRELTT